MLDFTRQQRVVQHLPHPEFGRLPLEQEAWMTLLAGNPVYSEGQLDYKYAHACPLTDEELAQAETIGLCGPQRVGENANRLSCRFKKEFQSSQESTLPLREVPEMELALQAMLACSLTEPYVHNIRMSPLQDLVSSYWTEAMSIFNKCVDELRVSTCPQMLEFRAWTGNPGKLTPIHLIPVGDVNHKRARFYAYPKVWDVFATAFDPAYAACPSFYCQHPNATDEPATRRVAPPGAAAHRRAAADSLADEATESE